MGSHRAGGGGGRRRRPGAPTDVTVADVEQAIDRAAVRYDRDGDQHYDITSALIKSIRGSDVDAALHYLARMVEAGEDPRFVARRLVILASEDVGLADPTALPIAVAAMQAVSLVGYPEAQINLAQAVIHLSLAPKSNAVILAIGAATSDVRAGLGGPVPPGPARRALRRAPRRSGTARATATRTTSRTASSSSSTPPMPWSPAATTSPTQNGAERDLAVRAERLRALVRGEDPPAAG